jgi:hypothetical protein
MIIQAILFILLIIAAIIYFKYFSHHVVGRLFVLTIGLVLFIFILFPPLAHRAAWFLGVGRGVDLIFYLAHAFLLILVGMLYIKQKKQQVIITELVRKISIERTVRNNNKCT